MGARVGRTAPLRRHVCLVCNSRSARDLEDGVAVHEALGGDVGPLTHR